MKKRERIAHLEKTVLGLEALRPVWAQYGTSQHEVAAQALAAALGQIWLALGVSSQTAAMERLKELMRDD